MTETVNKSKLMKLRVDSNMIADYGRVIKLKNSPSHHWSAVEDGLVRLPRHWNAISNALHEIPIKNDKRVLLELCSIIHPVRHIQTVAQKTEELVVFQVYLLMMQLYFGLLSKHNSLDLYDPSLTITLTADSTSTTAKKLVEFCMGAYLRTVQLADCLVGMPPRTVQLADPVSETYARTTASVTTGPYRHLYKVCNIQPVHNTVNQGNFHIFGHAFIRH